MAKHTRSLTPEEREWAVALADGPAAAEQPLLRLAARMEREGDTEDQCIALSELLQHYAAYGVRKKGLQVVERLEALVTAADGGVSSEVGGWLDLSVARTLLFSLETYEPAERLVDRALERLQPDDTLTGRYHDVALLKSFKLAVQVARGASRATIDAAIEDVCSAVGANFAASELVPTFRKLVEDRYPEEPLAFIIQKLWAELSRQHKFYGSGSRETISEIEELIATLQERGRHPSQPPSGVAPETRS